MGPGHYAQNRLRSFAAGSLLVHLVAVHRDREECRRSAGADFVERCGHVEVGFGFATGSRV